MSKSHARSLVSVSPLLVEQPTHEQWAELHRQTGTGRITKQLMQAFLRGQFTMKEIKRDEWINREKTMLAGIMDNVDLIAEAWKKEVGVHHRYMPEKLMMMPLFEWCESVGMKIYNKSIPSNGEVLPTERGVIECDLERMMTATNENQHPFNLDFNGHRAWTREEGGDNLTSAEETLFLMGRTRREFGHIPFMGGWIRCRNKCGSDKSLGVFWIADDGLRVSTGTLACQSWCFGAVPRKFKPVGV